MSLHDRIMALSIDKDAHPVEKIGFRIARKEAAMIAEEADELMAEMAAALEEAMGWNWMDKIEPVPDRVEYQVTDVLSKYKAMKEPTK